MGAESGSIGVGFSIPSNIVQRVTDEIIENGAATHGLLGASVSPAASVEGSTITGAYIGEVVDGGAAAAAGLQEGDIVTEFNGVPITDATDLTAQVRAAAAGSDATVTFVRDGKTQTVDVTLGELSCKPVSVARLRPRIRTPPRDRLAGWRPSRSARETRGSSRASRSTPLGRLATLVIPRTPGAWVFGCGAGIGDGALALWELVAAEGHPAVWLVGTAREERDAAARGIRYVRKHSLRGFWLTARAAIVVVTHGFGDVNRYAVSGAFIVQLWHGIPLKRIGLDSPETLRSGILPQSRVVRAALSRMYRGAARRIRVLPAASHLARGRLESAFGLPDAHVPVTGEPRVDVLSRGTADTRRSQARAAIGAAAGPLDASARLVLYAPTWRDGAPDPAVPSAQEWRVDRRRADATQRRAAGPLAPARGGRVLRAVSDRARPEPRQRARRRRDAAAARLRRARHRLLLARVRRGAGAAPGRLPRTRRRGVRPHAAGSTARTPTWRARDGPWTGRRPPRSWTPCSATSPSESRAPSAPSG